MKATAKPIRKENIHARKLGGEWLLYDGELEKVHILNPTAEFVWRLCDGQHDMAAIRSRMLEKYSVQDASQLDSDLKKILEEFDHINVLQKAEY